MLLANNPPLNEKDEDFQNSDRSVIRLYHRIRIERTRAREARSFYNDFSITTCRRNVRWDFDIPVPYEVLATISWWRERNELVKESSHQNRYKHEDFTIRKFVCTCTQHLLVFNSLYSMCISLGNRQDSNVQKGQQINNFISTQLKIRTC